MAGALRHLNELQEEQDRRDRGLARVYRPGKQQERVHLSGASELLARGGKRSGKSVSVAREFAARVTGEQVIGIDGEPIPLKWPTAAPDYPRIYWIIGWDTKHIGQTIFRLLFEPGQGGSFRVIKDLKTDKWRSFNRANKEDAKRIKQSKLSEPLIPERLWDGNFDTAFDWEDKKARHFNSLRLKNGAIVYAYPSSARNPKQGDAVSGIWVDEDIQFPSHLKEWQDRLTDEEGWFLWSVWPHMKNEALLDLINRAEMAELDENPQIECVQLIMTENEFLTEKGKKESLGRMGSDEEVARRNRGDLLIDSLSMYQFSPSIHQIQRPGPISHYELPEAHRLLRDIWLSTNTFPRTWTRYLSMDPSNTRTAVHSWVVPPPEYEGTWIGNVAIAEWELIARRFSADLLAKTLQEMMGTNWYESFIIDMRAGRQTHAGRDTSTSSHYAAAFRKYKLRSRQTSYSFVSGCDIPQIRHRSVRDMLLTDENTGMPQLLFVEERCVETKREFGKYRKKTEARGENMDSVLDEPSNPRLYDAMACHDAKTEVLTDSGWKLFSALDRSEKLATVNVAKDEIQFQRPHSLYQSQYSGEMIKFGGMKNDALVTPNHRMLAYGYNKGCVERDAIPDFIEAGDMGRWKNLKVAAINWNGYDSEDPVLIPRVSGGHTAEKEVDRVLLARLLGWYASEGCCQTVPKCPGVGYRVTISQKKPAGRAMIEQLLSDLPWKWYKCGSNYTIHNKQLWTYLSQFGKGFKEKFVPQWVKDSSHRVIKEYLATAIAGDGNVQFGKRNYYTSSPRMADDVQELLLKLGVCASLHLRKESVGVIRGREVRSTCPHYRVLERVRRIASLANHEGVPNFEPVLYEGMVYCAGVKNGTLITRRNGRILFSGNSTEYFAAYIEPQFLVGQAYVDPSMYPSRSAGLMEKVKAIKSRLEGRPSEVVYLGAGGYNPES